MNTRFPRYLLASSFAVAALWATQSTAATDPISACETHLIAGGTSYPYKPASAHRGGKVVLALTIAPNGQVAAATVRSSSRSRALDAAALDGALSTWRFAPSSCGALIATEVAVEFEPRKPYTFAAARAFSDRQKLGAERGCEVSNAGARNAVISCIVGAPAKQRLAKR